MNSEAYKTVVSINYALSEKFPSGDWVVTYCTDGVNETINFCGIVIWSKDDDERTFDDKIDDYEPLEQFIWKKLSLIVSDLGSMRQIKLAML